MIIWLLLGVLNILGMSLNLWTGMTYGFSFLTTFCVLLNTFVAAFCFIKAANAND